MSVKEFLDKAPDIIDKAAQSPWGLAALSVLVLGIVGAFLFRNAAGKLKLAAFAMITGGFFGLIALVLIPSFLWSQPPEPPAKKMAIIAIFDISDFGPMASLDFPNGAWKSDVSKRDAMVYHDSVLVILRGVVLYKSSGCRVSSWNTQN